MKGKEIWNIVFCTISVTAFLVSCSTNKRLVALKNEVVIKDDQQRLMLDKIVELDKKNKTKLSQNETDDSTSQGIQKMLDRLKGNTSLDIQNDSTLFAKKKIKRRQLNLIQKIVRESETKDVLAIDDISLLTDLLNENTFTRLNMAAFFDPGSYTVDADKLPEAIASFTPVAKEIQKFTSKYQSRKLKITIVSVGYADEEPITVNTELYKKLSINVGDTLIPSRQRLNAELSRLRAFSISNLIKNINDTEKPQTELNNYKVIYLAQGRGELLPIPGINDYTADDERRRIVVIYWGALPQD
jgi:hypothetical protein